MNKTPADILEAAGVSILDEEALRDWPPSAERRPGEERGAQGAGDRPKAAVLRQGCGPPSPPELQRRGAAFLFFTAPWCEVSLEAAPRFAKLFAKLNEEFPGRAEFGQVDADRAPAAAERLNVRSVPAVVAYARGREISRRVGLADEEELGRLVTEALREAEAGAESDDDAASDGGVPSDGHEG